MPQADPFAAYYVKTQAAPADDPFASYYADAPPADAEPAMTLNPSAGYYGGAWEAAKGFGKKAAQTAVRLGGIVHKIPGVSETMDEAWDAVFSHGDPMRRAKDLSANAFPAAVDATEPTNKLQRIGAGAEQIAEFLAPGAIGEKTAATIAAKAAPYFRNAPRLVQAAVTLAPRMVNEAGKSAAVAAVQGGDPVTAAEFGLAGPVVGKAVGAAGRYVGAKASKLVNSLNMLPASADDAIALAVREGVPLNAATASGNPYVKSIQHMADRSLVGSVVAGRASKAEAEGLAALGERLAAKSSPGRVTAAEAGSGAQKGIGGVVRTQKRAADTAYGRFRAIEADPANLTEIAPMPVTHNPDAPFSFTAKGKPTVEDVFPEALKDARANGYTGTVEDLRQKFTARVEQARGLKAASAEGDEYGHAALLKEIRSRGGLRPSDPSFAQGAPTRQLRGEHTAAQQANANYYGKNAVYRTDGLATDDMLQQLSEDPKWGAVITPDTDLTDLIHRGALTKIEPPGNLEHHLRGVGVQPGATWWLEGEAAQHIPMATDLSEVKAAIAPIAERLAAKRAITGVLLGKEGQSAAAIEAILNGPDAVSASVADSILSDLKGMARTNHPDLRTVGQGIAAKAVSNLHRAVGEAAERAGPEAVASLEAGRIATKAKYAAGKLLENLEGKAGDKSPVTAFRSMTGADDLGAGRLRAVLGKTPETKPLIARAVLDRLINRENVGPAKAWTDWQKLGRETKELLYTADHEKDLDAFFKLRKMMAENVNPSGSAHTAVNYVKGAFTYANPLAGVAWHITDGTVASLLHSRAGVRLLTRGMRMPAKNTAASAAWAEDFTTMLARVGAGATSGAPARRP